MSATANSTLAWASGLKRTPSSGAVRVLVCVVWLVWVFPVTAALEGETPSWATNAAEALRVNGVFERARERHQGALTNLAFAWEFGRACFDRAEFANHNTERASLAEQGIAACRRVTTQSPELAAGHYYLAMNQGQLARTKLLGALKLVKEIEAGFLRARQRDAHFDFAGPDRNLGLLYFEAPGWPTSIGSHTKARRHLRSAVELAPDYPENRLCLLEAYALWDNAQDAERELEALRERWPAARARLTGEAWAASWENWESRRERMETALGKRPKPAASPRTKD